MQISMLAFEQALIIGEISTPYLVKYRLSAGHVPVNIGPGSFGLLCNLGGKRHGPQVTKSIRHLLNVRREVVTRGMGATREGEDHDVGTQRVVHHIHVAVRM